MDENLRQPTAGEAPTVNSPPDLSLVQEGEEKAHEAATETVEEPKEEEKKEIAVETVKPKRKRRARKKKAVKPNPMALTKMEVMELDLNQARVDMQATVLQNLKMKEQILAGEYQRQRDHLRTKQRDTVISMEQCKEEYNQTRINIQERIGISLDECTVRQDGVLIPIDKDGNPEYVGDGG